MEDLSLNILDIAQNSLAAGAKRLRIEIGEFPGEDLLEILIGDDGRGMDKELLERVTDPFVTTRKTRNVGLGIPLLKMAAEMAGGSFSIESRPGEGTAVSASFKYSHIDRPPIGSMAETITAIIQGRPDISLLYKRSEGRKTFEFDTEDIYPSLGDIPPNEPEILQWIREYIEENEAELKDRSEE
jgi:anti-sigma regulatory factor (Ser/Thr protein kinase)